MVQRRSVGPQGRYVLIGLTALALSAAGCGAARYPVEGTVTLDGQPLASGEVSLYPDGDGPIPSDQIPAGEIKPGGKFAVATRDGHGVAPGKYRAVVTSPTSERPKNVPANPVGYYSRIDKKYTDRSTTPLRVEVVASPPPGAYDLVVTR